MNICNLYCCFSDWFLVWLLFSMSVILVMYKFLMPCRQHNSGRVGSKILPLNRRKRCRRLLLPYRKRKPGIKQVKDFFSVYVSLSFVQVPRYLGGGDTQPILLPRKKVARDPSSSLLTEGEFARGRRRRSVMGKINSRENLIRRKLISLRYMEK